MLKTSLITIVLLVSLCITGYPQEIPEIKTCDIIMWRPIAYQLFPGAMIPSEAPEFLCDNIDKLWYHVDFVTDGDRGLLMTATPDAGAGATSTLDSRLDSGTWTDAIVLRCDTCNCDEMLIVADELEGAYDWVGYYLHVLDLSLFCSKLSFFRGIPRPLFDYHCASFVFTVTGIVDNPHVATPFDIVNDINSGIITDWEIVE